MLRPLKVGRSPKPVSKAMVDTGADGEAHGGATHPHAKQELVGRHADRLPEVRRK
jgi:hypothetical protein